MPESIPLSYFQELADPARLIEVLQSLRIALKGRPNGLDQQIEILIEEVCRILAEEAPEKMEAETLTEVGEFGTHLLERLYFESLKNPAFLRMFNYVALAFTYWVARNGGSVGHLDIFVNALAMVANVVHDKISLESLYEATTFVVFSTKDELKSGPEVFSPDNPWRVLIMNYGIIATRTHTPELMESAYKTLLRYFPDEAPDFFRKAMSEMDRLNYPDYVRAVVERFYADSQG